MKNRRLILPSILVLIVLTAVLLFLLSKNEPTNSMQTESTGHTVGFIESASSYPVEDSTAPEEENTMEDTIVQNPLVLETMASSPLPTKDEFFTDALFIGDSRTVGLRDYAELKTATFFAYSGLSSFSVFKKTLDVPGLGEATLEALLTTQHYGKIYLMLGINELGYPLSSIRSQYTHVATRIHELHPDARIILCANLRVVADGKEKRDYVANETIDQVNEHIASLADNKTFFYIDVNPLFDDGTGALDPQYCADDLHPYGKYYYQWGEWLYEIGTLVNQNEEP